MVPSNSPQSVFITSKSQIFRFSPIENMFGVIKRNLQDLEFEAKGINKARILTKAVLDQCYGFKTK